MTEPILHTQIQGDWLYISSPVWESYFGSNAPLSVNRKIYKEIKEIERILKLHNSHLRGFTCYTRLDNTQTMRLLTKWGCKPLGIDLDKDIITFYKEIK